MQWEFQVGPSVGISAGDELWVARYILEVNNGFCHRYLHQQFLLKMELTITSLFLLFRGSLRLPVWFFPLTQNQLRLNPFPLHPLLLYSITLVIIEL